MQYLFTWEYDHEHYLNDVKSKEKYKREVLQAMEESRLPFFIKRRAIKLAKQLCELQFLLEETEQRNLALNEEIWVSDCLEYNVNQIYKYAIQNKIEFQEVNVSEVIEYCNVDNNLDIRFVKMNDSLRKSKEENPVIILESEMFMHPFIVNGNHRIGEANKKGRNTIKAWVLDADSVIHCLISEDYKAAYAIYKKFYRLLGLKLNC